VRGAARLVRVGAELSTVTHELDQLRVQAGWLQSRAVADLDDVEAAEFRVFSQFGEDGIIQFLIRRVPIENEVFVEFGVSDYREANTRFLLVQDNWRGLILDAADDHRRFVEASGLAWRHDIDAVSAFIDRENIDRLISSSGIRGDIGLLSIDLDGNDYWVLEAIESVSPRIIVAEYNSVFGSEAEVSVPYEPTFVRDRAHWSSLYWGASIAALAELATRKGYALVAGNRAGNNAFFVRRDVLGDLAERRPAEVYRPSRFRESRDRAGDLTYVSDVEERLRLIGELPVWDVQRKAEVTIAERFGLD
jgi:hypothetical protein